MIWMRFIKIAVPYCCGNVHGFGEIFHFLLQGTRTTVNILLLSRAVRIVAVSGSVSEANDTPRG